MSSTCDDGSAPATSASRRRDRDVHLPRHAEKGAILITKTRKHAADGPGDHPHAA